MENRPRKQEKCSPPSENTRTKPRGEETFRPARTALREGVRGKSRAINLVEEKIVSRLVFKMSTKQTANASLDYGPTGRFRTLVDKGESSSGHFFHCEDTLTGEMVFVEVLSKRFSQLVGKNNLVISLQHRNILDTKLVRGPHVLKAMTLWKPETRMLRITSVSDQNCLRDIISEHLALKPVLEKEESLFHVVWEEPYIAYLLKEILQGLAYLHSNHVIMNKMSSCYVLINSQGEVKLADHKMHDFLNTAGQWTTLLWTAPEVLRAMAYDSSADIWSVGVCAMELSQGRNPYDTNTNPLRILMKIISKQFLYIFCAQ